MVRLSVPLQDKFQKINGESPQNCKRAGNSSLKARQDCRSSYASVCSRFRFARRRPDPRKAVSGASFVKTLGFGIMWPVQASHFTRAHALRRSDLDGLEHHLRVILTNAVRSPRRNALPLLRCNIDRLVTYSQYGVSERSNGPP